MATNFTSLGVKNTLAVGGLSTLASVIITTATITTLGVTTLNATTANVQTLSGATISMLDSGDIARVRTLSGITLSLNGGGSGKILCGKTNGAVGYCSAATYGAGVCNCQ